MNSYLHSLTVLVFFMVIAPHGQAETVTADVVVYGGTAGGAMAAIAAANTGAKVVLVEPMQHIGGMVTGGLGATDFGKKMVIGGMARGFFARMGPHYGEMIAWFFEPHVAEVTMNDWLREAGVTVRLGERAEAVEKDGARIISFATQQNTYAAKVFVDASYEGDLMARAGVSYTVGREGRVAYGETLAGVRAHMPYHQFEKAVSAYDDSGNLIPLVQDAGPGEIGSGDEKVQAYNFRMCLSDDPENRVPIPKPTAYDPARYEILRRFLAVNPGVALKEMLGISRMPNHKTDINNKGPISTDHIGANWDYPDADYDRRAEIWEDHKQYVLGLVYFLANDSSVPAALQAEVNTWGLARDEFVDNDYWPYQLYVREARRMRGDYVMTESDILERQTQPDSVGMGSYNIDSHNVQRYATPEGNVLNEGDVEIGVPPYEIPYRVLLPKRGECTNLLVSSCLSATHVAYGTLRMEPQYMILGQAAGIAAVLASKKNTAVQDVDIDALQERLRAGEAVLSLKDAPAPYLSSKKMDGIVVDDAHADKHGPWSTSASVGPYVDFGYLHDQETRGPEVNVTFNAALKDPGRYEVRFYYTAHPNRASNVPITVVCGNKEFNITLDERTHGENEGYTVLGTFDFPINVARVRVDTNGTDGYVIADAVQWILVN